jgi:hypothetical protein
MEMLVYVLQTLTHLLMDLSIVIFTCVVTIKKQVQ